MKKQTDFSNKLLLYGKRDIIAVFWQTLYPMDFLNAPLNRGLFANL
jgi:hypothetical protein